MEKIQKVHKKYASIFHYENLSFIDTLIYILVVIIIQHFPHYCLLCVLWYTGLVALYFICRQVVPIKILPECIFVQFIKLQTDTLVWKWIFLTKEIFYSPNKPPSIQQEKIISVLLLILV